jgi:hypothetical protein
MVAKLKVQPPLIIIGRFYTTFSLAIFPVVIIFTLGLMLGFEEHGSQSQGAGALLVVVALVLGSLGINTLIVVALSYFVKDIRPLKKQLIVSFIVLAVLASLIFSSLTK